MTSSESGPALSVLDQSIARQIDAAPEALAETLAMARWCEELGYKRFWVSEHHAFPLVAGSSPEVLLAAIGANTRHIRIGAGGIMLPHYSPYKVAENVSVLANLYPGRVDLGLGRAPGTDDTSAAALAYHRAPQFDHFPKMVDELLDYLQSPDTRPKVFPKPPVSLPVWILGSTPASAALAARLGMPYNLAAFINPAVTADITGHYRNSFAPSAKHRTPRVTLTISAFCADTEARAVQLQQAYNANLYEFVVRGKRDKKALLPPEETARQPKSQEKEKFLQMRATHSAAGTPEQVAGIIKTLADDFMADEIMLVTNTYHFEDRKRSFQLIKEAMVANPAH